IVAPFIAVLTILLSKKASSAFYQIRESFSRLNTMVEEHIGGNKVVLAFAREDYEIEKFNVRNEDFRQHNLNYAKISSTYLPAIELFASLMSVIAMGDGVMFVISNAMSIGDFVTFTGLIWMVNVPMRNVGNHVNDLQNFDASTLKIREMLAIEPEIPVEERISI